MPIQKFSLFTSFAFATMLASLTKAADPIAAPPTLPAELAQLLASSYPASSLVAATPCKLGQAKSDSYGILLQTQRSEALVAYSKQGRWKLKVVSRGVSNSYGGIHDFLRDFEDKQGKLKNKLRIRCASPKKDEDIGVDANGEFIAKFAKNYGADIKHLCFEASVAYNSWTCLTLDPKDGTPVPSFAQMNAD